MKILNSNSEAGDVKKNGDKALFKMDLSNTL